MRLRDLALEHFVREVGIDEGAPEIQSGIIACELLKDRA
jgi:hypothetical protein